MAEVPTVRIFMPHGSGDYAIINLSDFDPTQHVLCDGSPRCLWRAPETIEDDVRRMTEAELAEGLDRLLGLPSAAPIEDDVSRETPEGAYPEPRDDLDGGRMVIPLPRKRGRPRKDAP